MAYQQMGYLPEALVNYLVRLGWSFGDEEIFSMEDLIGKFNLDNVGRSAGVFNPEKLLWLNSHYIKTGDPLRLAALLKPFLQEKGVELLQHGPDLVAVVKSLQERAATLVEMAEEAAFYFIDDVIYEEKAQRKFLRPEQKPLFETLIAEFEQCPEFTEELLERSFARMMEITGLKFGKVAQPLRVALTGGTASPSIYEVLQVLGKDRSLQRIRKALLTL